MKEGTLSLQNWRRKEKVPFVIYADFEVLNQKVNFQKGKTRTYQKHRACGFCFQVVCVFDEKVVFEPVLFRTKREEEDVGQIFVETLKKEIKTLYKKFDRRKKMIFTEEDKKHYENSWACWICGEEINPLEKSKNYKTVRDHNHFTGRYRGPAHGKCNLNF